MEAAPGQKKLRLNILPPAASASPRLGSQLFATDSLAFLAWLFLPLSAHQIRGGAGPLSPLPLCLLEHGCRCG